jgi:hypothetical protein
MQARGSIDPNRETGWVFHLDAHGVQRLLRAGIPFERPRTASLTHTRPF